MGLHARTTSLEPSGVIRHRADHIEGVLDLDQQGEKYAFELAFDVACSVPGAFYHQKAIYTSVTGPGVSGARCASFSGPMSLVTSCYVGTLALEFDSIASGYLVHACGDPLVSLGN